MNSNTLCLRIFFVLVIVLVGGGVLFSYGARAIAPLAIGLLPTETAEAHYTSDRTMVEYRLNSTQQLFQSQITYAGNTGTLLTTTPPAGPAVDVRYVRAFPSLVVRELPNATLGSYYADIWTGHDLTSFLVPSAIVLLAIFFFYRHLRNSRPRYRR